jgi:hypothetical protein
MDRLLFGIALCLFSQSLQAQTDSLFIRRIADEVFQHSEAYRNLRVLTKSIGPRLSGSPQTYTSERWGEKALRDAGADTVYLQQCKIPHWVRGGRDRAAVIAAGKRTSLQVIALGNSVGTKRGGITAPMLLVNNFEELEKKKDEVRGKIVFYNYPFQVKFVHTFMAYFDAVPYRVQGPSRAAKYGALGVIVRSMSSSTDNFPHGGAMRYDSAYPKIPALAVGLKDADKLAALAAGNKNPAIFISTNAHTLPDTIGYNVIGEWRGSEFPDQYITVGGHLDSWDPAEGAQDDGAGCVHSIEVLRALKAIGYRPRHTIRVVLFTDEENRGSGASKYVSAARERNEKHIFALESDAGGFTPRSFSVKAGAEQISRLNSWIPLLSPYGVTEILNMGAGMDVEPLYDAFNTPAAELIPDSQRYFDYHHAGNDVFEIVNKRELELGAINMAALIYLVDQHGL